MSEMVERLDDLLAEQHPRMTYAEQIALQHRIDRCVARLFSDHRVAINETADA